MQEFEVSFGIFYKVTNMVFFGQIWVVDRSHRQTKNYFFQNALEIYTYSEAEWCPKHDVAFSLSLN